MTPFVRGWPAQTSSGPARYTHAGYLQQAGHWPQHVPPQQLSPPQQSAQQAGHLSQHTVPAQHFASAASGEDAKPSPPKEVAARTTAFRSMVFMVLPFQMRTVAGTPKSESGNRRCVVETDELSGVGERRRAWSASLLRRWLRRWMFFADREGGGSRRRRSNRSGRQNRQRHKLRR